MEVLGRPENGGTTNVWYTLMSIEGAEVKVQLIPVDYDFKSLAAEMKSKSMPARSIETITAGWWTACLEVFPHKERARGRY